MRNRGFGETGEMGKTEEMEEMGEIRETDMRKSFVKSGTA
jgi:hypothetical protein